MEGQVHTGLPCQWSRIARGGPDQHMRQPKPQPRARRIPAWTGRKNCQPTRLPSGDPVRQLLRYRLLNSVHFPFSYLEQRWNKGGTKVSQGGKRKPQKAREPTTKVISSSPSAEEQSPEHLVHWSPALGARSFARHCLLLLSPPVLQHWPHRRLQPPGLQCSIVTQSHC